MSKAGRQRHESNTGAGVGQRLHDGRQVAAREVAAPVAVRAVEAKVFRKGGRVSLAVRAVYGRLISAFGLSLEQCASVCNEFSAHN